MNKGGAVLPSEQAATSHCHAVAFAPDGRTLATAGADVILWDVSDPARPRRLGAPLTAHTSGVSSVAYAPDGRTLATASADNTAIVWDLSDPARPRQLGEPLTGHTSAVESVAFAPDGRTLATAGFDRTVIMWDLTGLNELRVHAVQRACAITPGGLSPEDWARYVPGLNYESPCTSP
jgi:WD40 repeat protein